MIAGAELEKRFCGSGDLRETHCRLRGTCPPGGQAHRYYLKLYALDRVLELKPGATRKEIEQAIRKSTLVECQLMGTYKRK